MHKTDIALDNLDLRSLRILKLLLETRSVTKTGEAMKISQPAASRVLAQLRNALGDPLLVRGRHGNTLTSRAEILRPMLAEALRAISTLFAQEVFDAKSTTLTIRVAATDHGAAVVLAPLVQQLSTLAPNVTINVSSWTGQTLSELENGRLDLALDAETELPDTFHSRALFRDKYACLVRRHHPVLDSLRRDGSLNPQAAAVYPQITLLYPVGNHLEGDDVLLRLGHRAGRIAMRTPYFASVPLLLSGTDNLLMLPMRLGEMLSKSAPVVLIPLHAETHFTYRLIWHERTQRDVAMGWIRRQMYQIFAKENLGIRR